jgi:hypothetical protein
LEFWSFAQQIGDYGRFEAHEAFMARLRAKHGRKTGSWTLLSDTTPGRA